MQSFDIGSDVPDHPMIISDITMHSMGVSLSRYVESRVHEYVDEAQYDVVRVIGSYDRKKKVSRKEKTDKLENWQRPTAEIVNGELLIHCFPGRAYVFHYGSLVATHLSLTARNPHLVHIELPSALEVAGEVESLGFSSVCSTETVIVASGNEMLAGANVEWMDHGSFLTRRERIGSQSVTWLAVKHSFWGDIAFHMGKALATSGFARVIFVGKLGSLRPEHVPNCTIVTGSSSLLGGRMVSWVNLFHKANTTILTGRHITLPSVLQETVEWVEAHKESSDFVDPEIGNFAAGVLGSGSHFSYLHLVSDNVSQKYDYDLSNERVAIVRLDRAKAYKQISDALKAELGH